MTKADKFLALILACFTLVLYGGLSMAQALLNTDSKVAVVYFQDTELARYDMNQDQTHTVQGLLGDVVIEIKDKQIRVEKETSPYHYCSLQGWVSQSDMVIICLPNGIWIHIQNADQNHKTEPEVDVVIG